MRAAEVRFYVDADLLGLAKVLGRLRTDLTYPGDPGIELHRRRRPPCPIQRAGTPDQEWIGVVGRRGWLAITRDSAIRTRRAEVAAVREHGARLVALAGGEATSIWAQLEILMCRWRGIESLLDAPGPFLYTATRTGMSAVPL